MQHLTIGTMWGGPGPVGPGSGVKVSYVDYCPWLTDKAFGVWRHPITFIYRYECKHGRTFSVRYSPRLTILIQRMVIQYRYLPWLYVEDIIVNKSLTLNGPECTEWRLQGGRVEAVVVPATNAVSCGEIFHVTAHNVSIKGFTIDGDNTFHWPVGWRILQERIWMLPEGVTVYVDNVSNLTVTNNIFQNLSYFGVTLFGASYSSPTTSGMRCHITSFRISGLIQILIHRPAISTDGAAVCCCK